MRMKDAGKSEIRNPKSDLSAKASAKAEGNPKSETRKESGLTSTARPLGDEAQSRIEATSARPMREHISTSAVAFRISDFGFPSDFGFRVSDFHPRLPLARRYA
jgi:hypothetical protein